MCDVAYLCANFSLPRPLCSRLRPDVRDSQTSDRQTTDAHHRLMPPPYGGGGIISLSICWIEPEIFDGNISGYLLCRVFLTHCQLGMVIYYASAPIRRRH